jgi:hypothetical protein
MLGTTTSSTARTAAPKCKLLLDSSQLGCADASDAGCSGTGACCPAWHWPICHARWRAQDAASLAADRNDILMTTMATHCGELCCSYMKVTIQHLSCWIQVSFGLHKSRQSMIDSTQSTCKCRDGVAARSTAAVVLCCIHSSGADWPPFGRSFTRACDVAIRCHLQTVRHSPTSIISGSSLAACIAPVETSLSCVKSLHLTSSHLKSVSGARYISICIALTAVRHSSVRHILHRSRLGAGGLPCHEAVAAAMTGTSQSSVQRAVCIKSVGPGTFVRPTLLCQSACNAYSTCNTSTFSASTSPYLPHSHCSSLSCAAMTVQSMPSKRSSPQASAASQCEGRTASWLSRRRKCR